LILFHYLLSYLSFYIPPLTHHQGDSITIGLTMQAV
jgi:hypothetical protein